MTENSAKKGNEVFITHVFNAPRELVFKAWSKPEHLMHWFAPRGCTLNIYHFDFTPGGTYRHSIHNPVVRDCMCAGVFREIKEPEKIVYSIFFSDEKGNLLPPSIYGMDPDWPAEMLITITFEESEGKTKLTLHQTVDETLATRTGALPSWLDMFSRLEETLAQGLV